jgi:ADP-heptose:LPS heptosyltransferase
MEAKPGPSPSSWPKLDGEFEAALDLQGLLKSAIPVALAKAKRKLGYHWQREGAWLFSRAVIPDVSSHHIVDQYVDAARAAGGEADGADFGLTPSQADVESLRAALPERFVAINAGAGWASKRWPAASFARIVDELAEAGFQSVLIGGKAQADREAADAVLGACRERPLDMLGKTNIEELIALLSLARVHLGGDTGSTHLMAALGRPAVGLYSITRPKRSCPYGQVERCLFSPEGLDQISPESVRDALMEAVH